MLAGGALDFRVSGKKQSMIRNKFTFPNDNGEALSALLEVPNPRTWNGPPRAYAIFAHCFTCGKDIAAASRISRALTSKGMAVLRFDFTGLGNSDGDFGNSGFSSNVRDLIAAARYMAVNHEAPELLIGHSLGGAAVLCAAHQLPSVKAVATLGAPATADHVTHLFKDISQELDEDGEAMLNLAGREFSIRKNFLDDLRRYASPDSIRDLRRALLVLHAPLDRVVEIGEAARIFGAAMHPKSFVSLDDADHLLSRKEDAEYAAAVIAAWAEPYLSPPPETQIAQPGRPEIPAGEVLVEEFDSQFARDLWMESHKLVADEPKSFGGTNLGPNPYEFLLAALGACTSMTIRMYANHKRLPLEGVQVRVKHDRIHANDCAEYDGKREGSIERFQRWISFQGDLTEAQKKRLLQIADRCPVHRTLEAKPVILTTEAEGAQG